MNKMLRILEIVWLVIGIAGIGLLVYTLVSGGDKQQAIYFLLFTIVATIMFFVRRRQRKNHEKTATPKSND